MYCPGGNATDPIWRVLASSDRIFSWTPLKTQHSNPNPNRLANQLWCIDFLTPPTPLILPHGLPAFLESLMPLKNCCSIHARWPKVVWMIPYVSVTFFPSLKKNFIACLSSKVSSRPDCIFEILELWKSDFSRVYSNCWCRLSSNWSSDTYSSMWRGQEESVAYEFVLTSPAVSSISWSSYLDGSPP